MAVLLTNGTYIDPVTLSFTRTHILAGEGAEEGISFLDEIPVVNNHPVLDCSGRYITQAFANGHHHAYSALARGMRAPRKTPADFNEILQYIWWTLDKSLDEDMIRSSALVTALACAKNGVTFVIDHHASPFAVEGSLEIIAEAFESVGLGHLLCYEISDRDGMEIARKGLRETETYLSRRQGLIGLHASFTVGNETLRQAVDLARQMNSGIHMHVAEDISDENHCLENYHTWVIDRLAQAGVLDFPKTILAHCLHLDEYERRQLSGSPVWVVQNMESNLNNSVGLFNSKGLGDRIMFGTDGMHSDMLRSAKAAFFSGKNHENIDYAETYRRFRNVGNYLKENGFTGYRENNLVVIDYDSPTPFNQENFYGHFLFGLESKHIQHVIAQGKLIVRNGQVITVNEGEILEEARRQADRLWKKMQQS
ncbi:cytosine/adenosine deaminase [Lentimicrobium saccharophilum]|uniref:Cytosine/adenosine deaminase n=1 Tax=Lentimicrobium saccharophilum TaxID=1678841 RepID=A0A0S7BPX5_9BACT|nr:amidohydrolase family protein [Lentimicrobium saccharophilum]GAP42634.1 cytosine/adenosine deaminase [Lentimicrobium saccharophilum]